jgi:hypothetical protein
MLLLIRFEGGMLIRFLISGEKLDNLVAKSDNLSASSKMFYTQAKKQNSCCVVM